MRSLASILLCAISVLAAEPGQRAPGFALPDSKGDVIDLYDYRGKPVLLEFMQTTCPHCASFASVLEKVKAKYGDRLAIIAVANPPDNTSTVTAFIRGHNIQYPVLFDMGQAAYSYVRSMSFDLPQVYLIDAKGMIFNHYGYSALTRSIFEGDGLFGEIDRLFAAGAPHPAASPVRPGAKKE
jgi:peroxiredoxin